MNLDEDNKYYCEKCKKYVSAIAFKNKRSSFANLIIHLKRFDNFINKKNDLITYPRRINHK